MTPKDLLSQADSLVRLSPKRPKQANLRRAVSSAYYAVFHALCLSNANVLAGTGLNRPERAWLQVYRAVDHGQAKKRCKDARSKGFPSSIESFANAFVALQEYRHRADYNPDMGSRFTKDEVVVAVSLARSAIAAINSASVKNRKAFAIHVLLPYRD